LRREGETELSPIVPAGRQVIERYSAAGFQVSGLVYRGSVLVFPDRTLEWSAASVAGITIESLQPVFADGEVEILVLGLGKSAGLLERELRARLKEMGIAFEAMDTGAACRTYNVLSSEDRQVAAALIRPL
jgi:uncharacterized protein